MKDSERKGTAEATQQTVRFLENVLKASSDGIVVTDAFNNVVIVNDAFCEYFGTNRDKVTETDLSSFLALLGPEASSSWSRLEERIWTEKSISDSGIVLRNGVNPRFLSVNASLVDRVAEEDAPIVLSIWRDVTPQRVLQNALTERVRELNGLFDLGLLENSAGSLDEFLTAFVEEVAPGSMSAPESAIAIVELGNRRWSTRAGVPISLLSAPIVVEGHKMGELRLGYDCDPPLLEDFDKKMVETFASRLGVMIERDSLAKAKKLQSVVDSSDLGIVLAGHPKGMIAFANARFAHTFGFSSEDEIVGTDLGSLLGPELKKQSEKCIARSGFAHERVKVRRKDGVEFYADISAKICDDGRIVCLVSEVDRSLLIVVMCANCNRVRDGSEWVTPSSYFENHFESIKESDRPLGFSHGVCPECSEDLYGDILVATPLSK